MGRLKMCLAALALSACICLATPQSVGADILTPYPPSMESELDIGPTILYLRGPHYLLNDKVSTSWYHGEYDLNVIPPELYELWKLNCRKKYVEPDLSIRVDRGEAFPALIGLKFVRGSSGIKRDPFRPENLLVTAYVAIPDGCLWNQYCFGKPRDCLGGRYYVQDRLFRYYNPKIKTVIISVPEYAIIWR